MGKRAWPQQPVVTTPIKSKAVKNLCRELNFCLKYHSNKLRMSLKKNNNNNKKSMIVVDEKNLVMC
jgi:hypothetical protein